MPSDFNSDQNINGFMGLAENILIQYFHGAIRIQIQFSKTVILIWQAFNVDEENSGMRHLSKRSIQRYLKNNSFDQTRAKKQRINRQFF